MTKMLDPIEEAQRALRDENAMLRDEVNRLDDLISMLVEQGGQANVRAESAEDERDKLREVNRAQADNYTSLARQLADREEQLRKAQERIRAAEAERDMAWSEAIEAAARKSECFWPDVVDDMTWRDAQDIAAAIRSLAKEAGE
jgi:chromosome segregation ATPase